MLVQVPCVSVTQARAVGVSHTPSHSHRGLERETEAVYMANGSGTQMGLWWQCFLRAVR